MATSHSQDGWRPRWAYAGEPFGALIARNARDGLALSWISAEGDLPTVFIGEFLAARLQGLPLSETEAEANYFYVLLRRAPKPGDEGGTIGRETAIAEFGYGCPPSSPEDWPTRLISDLLKSAIDSLLGSRRIN
jgi:hypothetical protein